MYRFLRIKDQNLQHPLTLLILGTFLSSILIPALGYYLSEKRLLQQAQLDLANQIIEKDFMLSNQLNNLKTTLDIYNKDNCMLHVRADVPEQQRLLRWKMNELYLHFESNAWYWQELVYNKAFYLDMPRHKLDSLSKSLLDYHDNILHCTGAVSQLWQNCLRVDYHACDPRLDSMSQVVHQELTVQHQKRNLLVHKMIYYISGKQSYLLPE